MSSVLHNTHYLFHLAPLHSSAKIFNKSKLIKLQAVKGPLKGLVMKYFSTNHQEHWFQLTEYAKNYAHRLSKGDQADEDEHRTHNSGGVEDGDGNGNTGGNGNDHNDNGNRGDHGDDEDKECNQDELAGMEWWWWWKWRQACTRTQNGGTQSHLWPVDEAIKVATNEVMGNLKPAWPAVVLKPIRLHINTQGWILLVLLSIAFLVVACIHIVAGAAVFSVGASLAGLAAVAFALVWRAKRRGSHSQHSSKNQ